MLARIIIICQKNDAMLHNASPKRQPYSLQATAHSTTAYVDVVCDEVLSVLCHGSRCEEQSSPCLEPPALDFGDNGGECVWLIKLNRCPHEVLDPLMKGDDLQEVRLHLKAYGMQLVVHTGCKVFVWPSQYAQAIDALFNYLDSEKIKLKSSHIIVSHSVLPNLTTASDRFLLGTEGT